MRQTLSQVNCNFYHENYCKIKLHKTSVSNVKLYVK